MEQRKRVGRIAVGNSEGNSEAASPAAAAAPGAASRRHGSIRRRESGANRGGGSVRAHGTGGGRQLGFTASELLVTLGVAGVLLSLAVPGFAALTRSVGLSSAANELLAALHMARSSAVLRGLPVAVCLTADDRTCLATPDASATGWLVFVPGGVAAAVASRPVVVGEVLTRFHLPGRLTVSASRPTVTFWPVARAAATSTFDLCDLGGAGRSIVVSQTGRPRVAAEATSCA